MAKHIGAPLEKTFPLTRWDEKGETTVTIRQARQHEQEKHDNLFAETTRVWDSGEERVQIKQRVSSGEVIRTEAFLTMAGCNVPDEDGVTPLFQFKIDGNGRSRLDMSPHEFEVAWGKLPPELADEIHDKVREVNPQWGPQGKAG